MTYTVKEIDYDRRIVIITHTKDNHLVEDHIKVNPMNWAPGVWAGFEGKELTRHDINYMLGYDMFGGAKGD